MTSPSTAQFRYTLPLRTLLGFASRRDVGSEKEGHRHLQMSQQPLKHARKQRMNTQCVMVFK